MKIENIHQSAKQKFWNLPGFSQFAVCEKGGLREERKKPALKIRLHSFPPFVLPAGRRGDEPRKHQGKFLRREGRKHMNQKGGEPDAETAELKASRRGA